MRSVCCFAVATAEKVARLDGGLILVVSGVNTDVVVETDAVRVEVDADPVETRRLGPGFIAADEVLNDVEAV